MVETFSYNFGNETCEIPEETAKRPQVRPREVASPLPTGPTKLPRFSHGGVIVLPPLNPSTSCSKDAKCFFKLNIVCTDLFPKIETTFSQVKNISSS